MCMNFSNEYNLFPWQFSCMNLELISEIYIAYVFLAMHAASFLKKDVLQRFYLCNNCLNIYLQHSISCNFICSRLMPSHTKSSFFKKFLNRAVHMVSYGF